MSSAPRSSEEPPRQASAAEFASALSGAPTPGETAPPTAVPDTARSVPSADALPEAPPGEGRSAPPRTDLGSVVTSEGEPAPVEPALDRPGKPLLAGAAIGGLLLVVAPFAFSAGTQDLSLQSVPLSQGGLMGGGAAQGAALDGTSGDTSAELNPDGQAPEAAGEGTETGGGQAGGDTSPGSAPGEDGGDSSAEAAELPGADDPGYVPEPLSRDTDFAGPELPEGFGTAEDSGGAAVEEPQSGADDTPAADPEPEGTGEQSEPGGDPAPPAAEDGTEEPATEEEPAQEPGGEGTDPAGADGGVTAEPQEEADTEGAAEDTASGTEPAAASAPEEETAEQDTAGQDAEQEPADTTPQQEGAADASQAAPGTDGGGGSILEDAVESNGEAATAAAAAPEPFSALTGPGCLPAEGTAYGRSGRWDSAEGTASWATRPGGYALEGCDGSYEAIPVSGSAGEHDQWQYAYWSFSPGYPDATCEIYVHVPDDESPLWLAESEAFYEIYSGPLPEGDPIAYFGLTQSELRGMWVQVTGFTSPTEEFTVQLTNTGADAFADQEHTRSHVAASVVRTTCS
ncbi:hypothetical protein [Nocardiopsis sp. CNT312]|uniref:hypothetical protein n=1 Tax=Nocardiopsis sp. CNT312 TaxID=1137268 RepID=UPI00048CEC96|nr:hypothetical protein [Nocardiopsis sp. CNT312]